MAPKALPPKASLPARAKVGANAAKEIKRNQTDQESFGIEDIAIQASDQQKITTEEITILREEYQKMKEEREKVDN